MAKGRSRLTVSRSERYLGSNYSTTATYPGDTAPEFQENDVWETQQFSVSVYDESAWVARATPTRRDRQVGGLTLAFEDPGDRSEAAESRIVHQIGYAVEQQRRQVASSAPVNVPDWSKILRVSSAESMAESDGDLEEEIDAAVDDPPHEFLARSRGKNATSVFEGVGRTLKGRDLRRLRDTVWSQTGFDG